MKANFHWVSARVWYEIGIALHWGYAVRRGERHIRTWLRSSGVQVLGDDPK